MNTDNIPAQLKEIPRWVNWLSQDKGGPKPTKIPVDPKTGEFASSTNPKTWANFWKAVAGTERFKDKNVKGLGIVVDGTDGLIGIDLDKCRDMQTGNIEPWASEIVTALNSYTEISPSGTGLRIFVFGKLPQGRRKNGLIEAYENGRYLTVTGNHLFETPVKVERRNGELDLFHKQFLERTVLEKVDHETVSLHPWVIPGGESRHDFIFKMAARWRNNNVPREEAFTFANRVAEINNANGKRVISPLEIEKEIDFLYKNQSAKEPSKTFPSSIVMSLADFLLRDIPPRESIIETILLEQQLAMIYGARGRGKTWVAMMLAKSIASGTDFLFWKAPRSANVLYVDGEMTADELRNRFELLAGRTAIPNLYLISSQFFYKEVDEYMILNNLDHQKAFKHLLSDLRDQEINPKAIIFDNLSAMTCGIDENSNSEQDGILSFFRELRHMGYTIIFVHHTGKNGDQRGASRREDFLDLSIKLSDPSTPAIEGARFQVEFSKVRGKMPTPYSFECELISDESGLLTWSLSDQVKDIDALTSCLQYIQKTGTQMQIDIVKALNLPKGTVSKAVKKANEKRLLKGMDITPQGSAFLSKVENAE